MRLLIDAGNTRVKWVLEDGGVFVRSGDFTQEGLVDGVTSLFVDDESCGVESVWVSSVADETRSSVLQGELRQRFKLDAHFAVVKHRLCDVQAGYKELDRLGVDRWLAILAAYHDNRRNCMVVDAGSAITVDLVSSSGEHIGGWILPGCGATADALFAKASNVPVSSLSAEGVWGRTTSDCVALGFQSLWRGLVREACRSASEGFGGEAYDVYLAGGDAELLASYFGGSADSVIIDSALVLKGLSLYADSFKFCSIHV